MSNAAILAIDIGTSSLKAAIVDSTGSFHLNPCGTELLRVFFTQPVSTEQWVMAAMQAVDAAVQICPIAGIALSGNGPTIVAHCGGSITDDRIMLWNEKTTPSKNTGNSTSIFLPRLCAFKEQYPHDYERANMFFSAAEYLVFRLTGEQGTVLPEPRFLPAYWDDAQLAAVAIPKDKLPPFVSSGTRAGTYNGIPVFFAPPDFAAALIGTNTLSPGSACDRVGSSEGINICVNTPPSEAKKDIRVLPSLVSPFWNLSYLLPDSGALFMDYMNRHGYSHAAFEDCVSDVMQESSHSEGRRLLESIGFNARWGFDLLEQSTGYTPLYVLAGGQAHNRQWLQIKADMTNRKLALPQTPHAELLGDAVIACTALGLYNTISEAAAEMTHVNTVYYPNPNTAALYHEKYADYKTQQSKTAAAEKILKNPPTAKNIL